MKKILISILIFSFFGANISSAYFIGWSCDDMKTMLTNKAPIKFGDSGAYAGAVRVFLLNNGFLTIEESIKEDRSTGKYKRDYFGKKTQKAIIAFQKSHGIKQTGIVGPKTKEKMVQLACHK